MTFTQDTVHCITTTLTPDEATLAYVKSLLSPDELERAQKFHFERHRVHFIAARGFMRHLLGETLNQDPRKLIFSYGLHQKPALPNEPITFNLAHSGELALLAIGMQHPLGADIEIIQNTTNLDIAERFFSKEENEFLNSLTGTTQRNAFFTLWARKEAVVKAIGTGIQQSLSSFTVPFLDETAVITVDEHPWQVWPLNLHPGYASAIATHPSIKKLSCWQWVERKWQALDQNNPF